MGSPLEALPKVVRSTVERVSKDDPNLDLVSWGMRGVDTVAVDTVDDAALRYLAQALETNRHVRAVDLFNNPVSSTSAVDYACTDYGLLGRDECRGQPPHRCDATLRRRHGEGGRHEHCDRGERGLAAVSPAEYAGESCY